MKQIINQLLIFFFLAGGCSGKSALVDSAFDFADKQLKVALDSIDSTIDPNNPNRLFPRTNESDGRLTLTNYQEWTSGFFPGELWYMYEYTGDEFWKTTAEKYTGYMENGQYYAGNHDVGFRMYCSYGNGYRLTGDEKYKEILLQSAKSLLTRYRPQVGLIKSWNSNKVWQYPVIIDNMMNLELLFWASKISGDPVYHDVAVSHAKKTLENHFRENNISYHVFDYDTITGIAVQKQTAQGYAHESAWARGQAWGMYGFTVCYRETKDPAYLKKAKEIAAFIFSNPHLPADLIPYWDYDAPEIPNEPRDVSAATVTASALYELCLYDSENAVQYKKWADIILENLGKNYRAKLGHDNGFLLLHSTGSKPGKVEVDVPLVYADYYYLEALLRKQKIEK
jgi:hypothetical protein